MIQITPAHRHALKALGRLNVPAQAYGRRFVLAALRGVLAGQLTQLARNEDDLLWSVVHRHRRAFSASPLLCQRAEVYTEPCNAGNANSIAARNEFWRGYWSARVRLDQIAAYSAASRSGANQNPFQRIDDILAEVVGDLAAAMEGPNPSPLHLAFVEGAKTAHEIHRRRGMALEGQRQKNRRALSIARAHADSEGRLAGVA